MWRLRSFRCPITVAAVGAALTVGVVIGRAAPEQPTRRAGQHAYKAELIVRYQRDYLLYLPKGHDAPGKKWPLVLFLHGAGERGRDVEKVARHGPPKHISAGGEYPFVLVSPQCPPGQRWDPKVLKLLLDELMAELPIDPDRVCCTGLSMGGFGTWAMAAEYPKLFAAIVPICGGGDPKTAGRIASVPTWAFHGEKDSVVRPERTKEMIAALRAAGGEPKLTLYPQAGHDSWTRAYGDAELLTWLLAQKRSAAKKPD